MAKKVKKSELDALGKSGSKIRQTKSNKPEVDTKVVSTIVQEALSTPMQAMAKLIKQQADIVASLQETVNRQGKQIDAQSQQILNLSSKPKAKNFSIEFPDGRKAVMTPNYERLN